MEYDYIKVVEVLEAGGADGSLANNNGHSAATGIEGRKVRAMVMIAGGDCEADFSSGLTSLEGDAEARSKVDKAEFIQIRMKLKKANKGWTPAVDDQFKAILNQL